MSVDFSIPVDHPCTGADNGLQDKSSANEFPNGNFSEPVSSEKEKKEKKSPQRAVERTL